MTLPIYFAKRFLINFIRVLIAIGLIVFLIDLLENISRMSNTSTPITNAVTLTLFRAPFFLSQAMPLIVMLSSLAFCVGIARSSEFIISRAAGVSAIKSLLAPLLCAFVLGVVSIFSFQPFAGQLFENYEIKKAQLLGNASRNITIDENGFWMRQATPDGHQVIKANSASDNGKGLQGITVYDYNAQGAVIQRIYAETGFLRESEWVFINGVRWFDKDLHNAPENAKKTFGFMRLSTDITAEQLLDGYPKPQTLSPLALPGQIKIVESSGFSILKYRAHQINQFARPFLFMVMMAIGAIFTLNAARQGNLGVSVMLSLLFGFSLHFLNNFANTLGSSGEIPLILAVFAPIIAFGSIAISLFLHFEDG